MEARKVLISGTGVAGPCLAYWLRRRGFEPTLVERAPAPREGGYIIDFWGVGYDVAERMELLTRLREVGYGIYELSLVNERGRGVSGFGGHSLRRALDGRYFSILRGDLAHTLYTTVAGEVETIFGDAITVLEDGDAGVEVTLASGETRRFDLVVGADGLHSAVRGAAFGNDPAYERYLGYCVASFVLDDYPHRDEGAYIGFATPGRQIARYSLRDGRTGILLVFASDEPVLDANGDVPDQKRILREVFDVDGWETPEILAGLDDCSELYVDTVSQIRMSSWSRGRCALVGDAAHCPSLLSGEGAALAMAGAYVLAGELSRAPADHSRAFAAYERTLRPFIESKQKAAERFASSFAPRTRFGISVRNKATALLRVPYLSTLLMRRMFADRFALPEYDQPRTSPRPTVEAQRRPVP